MRAAFVGGFTMGHGTTNRNFVGDFGRVFEVLVDTNSFNIGLNGIQRASVFDRSKRFWIESFLVAHSTGKIDEDEGLRCSFLAFVIFDLGLSLFDLQELGQSQSNASGKSDM